MGDIKGGDQVPVIQCTACGHVTRVVSIPADDQGRPFRSFRHRCPQCGEEHQVLLSDIRVGVAHRKLARRSVRVWRSAANCRLATVKRG